jgi:hypothetical protein
MIRRLDSIGTGYCMDTGRCKDDFTLMTSIETSIGIVHVHQMEGHSHNTRSICIPFGGTESTFACESIGMYLIDAV